MSFTSFTFFLILIPILTIILLLVNFIFAPHLPYQEKGSTFECGFHSFLGQNRTQFNIVFFVFGLLFLLFDIEILMVYPYIVSNYTNDLYGLILTLAFLGLLTLGFVFELGKGALTLDSKQYLNNKYVSVSNPLMEQKPIKKNIISNTQKRMMTTIIMKKGNNNHNKFLLIATIIITLIILPMLALLFTNHVYYLIIYIITVTILSIAFYIIIFSDMSNERKSGLLISLYAGLTASILGILVRYFILVYLDIDVANIFENTIPSMTWYSSLCLIKIAFKQLFLNLIEDGFNLFFIKQTMGETVNLKLPHTKTYLAMNSDNQPSGSSTNPNNQTGGSNTNTNTYLPSGPSIAKSPPVSPGGNKVKLFDDNQFKADNDEIIKRGQLGLTEWERQAREKEMNDYAKMRTLIRSLKDTDAYFNNGEDKFVIVDPDGVASTTNPYIDPNTDKPYTNKSNNTYTNNLESFMKQYFINKGGSGQKKNHWKPIDVLSEKDYNFFVAFFRHKYPDDSILRSNNNKVRQSLRDEK